MAEGLLIAGICVGGSAAYTVVSGAIWERNHKADGNARELHPKLCGEPYPTLHYCSDHSNEGNRLGARYGHFHEECEKCWDISFTKCIPRRCKTAAAVDNTQVVLGSIFWLPMLPVWAGTRIGKRKKIRGRRYRRAERLAKSIADLEKEVFNG